MTNKQRCRVTPKTGDKRESKRRASQDRDAEMGWARTVAVNGGGGGGGGGFVLTMSLLWSIVERFHPAPRCVRDLHLFCGPNSEKLVSNLAKRKREAVGEGGERRIPSE